MNEETTTSLIDAALASGTASALDPEEYKLQELVLAIRDDAPAPEPDFELRMNARVAAGFPVRRVGFGGRLRALLATRPQLTALGVAASLLIALIVVVASGGSGGSSPAGAPETSRAPSVGASGGSATSAPNAAAQAPADKAVAPSGASGTTVVPAPPPVQPGGFVGGLNRKVERSASLVLAPAKDKLSEVGDEVIAVTDRYRGFVMQSSVTNTAGRGSSGSFDLRIPARTLRPALRDLSALADVKSRTENALDVTASFATARTRLQELTAERRGLLRRLATATTDRAAGAIRAQLRIVNSQIQAQTNKLTELRRTTNYASVSVTLEPRSAKSGGGGGGGIGKGFGDLRDSLVTSANIALRVLGIALPIALVVGLLWAAGGWLGRRRREAALN
jgi:Domain of unknown function (DUF4349)